MTPAPKVLGAREGTQRWLGALGIRLMVSGADSGGGFALVEHRLKPRALAGPLHRHAGEDEYSVILEGRVGAKLGDATVHGSPGDVIAKPRDQWHTFWNAGDTEARLLEIISPAGFEQYFEEMVAISGGGRPDPQLAAPIRERYRLDVDMASVAALVAEHKISFG